MAARAPTTWGDVLTFVNDVFDAANQVELGSDQGYCVRLVAGKAYECHWTLFLAGGQITVDGSITRRRRLHSGGRWGHGPL